MLDRRCMRNCGLSGTFSIFKKYEELVFYLLKYHSIMVRELRNVFQSKSTIKIRSFCVCELMEIIIVFSPLFSEIAKYKNMSAINALRLKRFSDGMTRLASCTVQRIHTAFFVLLYDQNEASLAIYFSSRSLHLSTHVAGKYTVSTLCGSRGSALSTCAWLIRNVYSCCVILVAMWR